MFGTFDKYICGFTNGQMIDHLLESGTDIKSQINYLIISVKI